MADASQSFAFTLPAGNGSNATAEYSMQLPICDVSKITITWPAGCAGLVGLAVQAAGTNAFPYIAGQFMNFDDYTYPLEVTNQLDSGDWSLLAYNADYFAHTVQLVMEYNYINTNSGVSSSLQVSA